jgi:hypothetical protein
MMDEIDVSNMTKLQMFKNSKRVPIINEFFKTSKTKKILRIFL